VDKAERDHLRRRIQAREDSGKLDTPIEHRQLAMLLDALDAAEAELAALRAEVERLSAKEAFVIEKEMMGDLIPLSNWKMPPDAKPVIDDAFLNRVVLARDLDVLRARLDSYWKIIQDAMPYIPGSSFVAAEIDAAEKERKT
jgi:hypothetical protein